MREMVEADGYSNVITITRNDRNAIPTLSTRAQRLVFMEAWSGGVNADQESYQIRSHSRIWRAYIDADSGRAYKIFGFASGNEFSDILSSYQIPGGPEEAQAIGEKYARVSYGERGEALRTEYETRRFLEEEFYRILEEDAAHSATKAFLKKNKTGIRAGLERAGVAVSGSANRVTLLVGRCSDLGRKGVLVEIRVLVLELSPSNGLSIIEDTEVGSTIVNVLDEAGEVIEWLRPS